MKTYVTFFTSTDGYGGCEIHMLRLIEHLDPLDFEVSLILHTPETLPPALHPLLACISKMQAQGNIKTFLHFRANHLGSKSARGVVAALRLAYLFQKQPGIIHFYKQSISTSIRAIWLARLVGKRTIQTLQLAPDPRTESSMSFGERRLAFYLRLSETVITVSEALRQLCIKEYNASPDRTVTIRNGIPIDQFSAQCGSREQMRRTLERDFGLSFEGRLVLLKAARLTDQKGHKYLFEALTILRQQSPDLFNKILILVAGEGEREAYLQNLTEELGLTDVVHFIGFRSDISNLLLAADAFVLTSNREGLPLSVIEAMAVSKPVLATTVDGTPEAVIDGDTGFLMQPKDPQSIANVLAKFVSLSNEERETMGRRGYSLAHQQFDLVKQVKTVQLIYRRVADRFMSKGPSSRTRFVGVEK